MTVSCATTQKYTYEISKPTAGPMDILQVCSSTDVDGVETVRVEEECPDGTTLRGTFFSTDFTRELLHYLDELEIRTD